MSDNRGQIGITPSTVLVTHLLIEQSTSWGLLLNELALFLIGTSFALLANLYMPSNQAAIDHYHDVVEDQLKKILGRFAELLGKGDGRNDARFIKELDGILKDALNLVYLDHSNHLFTKPTTTFTTSKCASAKTTSCGIWQKTSTAVS